MHFATRVIYYNDRYVGIVLHKEEAPPLPETDRIGNHHHPASAYAAAAAAGGCGGGGPCCPMVAIVNALSLRGSINLLPHILRGGVGVGVGMGVGLGGGGSTNHAISLASASAGAAADPSAALGTIGSIPSTVLINLVADALLTRMQQQENMERIQRLVTAAGPSLFAVANATQHSVAAAAAAGHCGGARRQRRDSAASGTSNSTSNAEGSRGGGGGGGSSRGISPRRYQRRMRRTDSHSHSHSNLLETDDGSSQQQTPQTYSSANSRSASGASSRASSQRAGGVRYRHDNDGNDNGSANAHQRGIDGRAVGLPPLAVSFPSSASAVARRCGGADLLAADDGASGNAENAISSTSSAAAVGADNGTNTRYGYQQQIQHSRCPSLDLRKVAAATIRPAGDDDDDGDEAAEEAAIVAAANALAGHPPSSSASVNNNNSTAAAAEAKVEEAARGVGSAGGKNTTVRVGGAEAQTASEPCNRRGATSSSLPAVTINEFAGDAEDVGTNAAKNNNTSNNNNFFGDDDDEADCFVSSMRATNGAANAITEAMAALQQEECRDEHTAEPIGANAALAVDDRSHAQCPFSGRSAAGPDLRNNTDTDAPPPSRARARHVRGNSSGSFVSHSRTATGDGIAAHCTTATTALAAGGIASAASIIAAGGSSVWATATSASSSTASPLAPTRAPTTLLLSSPEGGGPSFVWEGANNHPTAEGAAAVGGAVVDEADEGAEGGDASGRGSSEEGAEEAASGTLPHPYTPKPEGDSAADGALPCRGEEDGLSSAATSEAAMLTASAHPSFATAGNEGSEGERMARGGRPFPRTGSDGIAGGMGSRAVSASSGRSSTAASAVSTPPRGGGASERRHRRSSAAPSQPTTAASAPAAAPSTSALLEMVPLLLLGPSDDKAALLRPNLRFQSIDDCILETRRPADRRLLGHFGAASEGERAATSSSPPPSPFSASSSAAAAVGFSSSAAFPIPSPSFSSPSPLAVAAACGLRIVHAWLVDSQDVGLAREVTAAMGEFKEEGPSSYSAATAAAAAAIAASSSSKASAVGIGSEKCTYFDLLDALVLELAAEMIGSSYPHHSDGAEGAVSTYSDSHTRIAKGLNEFDRRITYPMEKGLWGHAAVEEPLPTPPTPSAVNNSRRNGQRCEGEGSQHEEEEMVDVRPAAAHGGSVSLVTNSSGIETGGESEVAVTSDGDGDDAKMALANRRRRAAEEYFRRRGAQQHTSSSAATAASSPPLPLPTFSSARLPFFQNFLETTLSAEAGGVAAGGAHDRLVATFGGLFALMDGIADREVCLLYNGGGIGGGTFSVLTRRGRELLELVSDEAIAIALVGGGLHSPEKNRNICWQTVASAEGGVGAGALQYRCLDTEPFFSSTLCGSPQTPAATAASAAFSSYGGASSAARAFFAAQSGGGSGREASGRGDFSSNSGGPPAAAGAAPAVAASAFASSFSPFAAGHSHHNQNILTASPMSTIRIEGSNTHPNGIGLIGGASPPSSLVGGVAAPSGPVLSSSSVQGGPHRITSLRQALALSADSVVGYPHTVVGIGGAGAGGLSPLPSSSSVGGGGFWSGAASSALPSSVASSLVSSRRGSHSNRSGGGPPPDSGSSMRSSTNSRQGGGYHHHHHGRHHHGHGGRPHSPPPHASQQPQSQLMTAAPPPPPPDTSQDAMLALRLHLEEQQAAAMAAERRFAYPPATATGSNGNNGSSPSSSSGVSSVFAALFGWQRAEGGGGHGSPSSARPHHHHHHHHHNHRPHRRGGGGGGGGEGDASLSAGFSAPRHTNTNSSNRNSVRRSQLLDMPPTATINPHLWDPSPSPSSPDGGYSSSGGSVGGGVGAAPPLQGRVISSVFSRGEGSQIGVGIVGASAVPPPHRSAVGTTYPAATGSSTPIGSTSGGSRITSGRSSMASTPLPAASATSSSSSVYDPRERVGVRGGGGWGPPAASSASSSARGTSFDDDDADTNGNSGGTQQCLIM